MRTRVILMMSLLTLVLGLGLGSVQADFIQCIGGGCNGTANHDIVNGSNIADNIFGLAGNDILFGGEGPDDLAGGDDDDIIFGGVGSDVMQGNNGNDMMFAGPDVAIGVQAVNGFVGNDTTYVFAGETQNCLYIDDTADNSGQDTAILVGFGPYSASHPFGQPNFGNGQIIIEDPIAGGLIFIEVHDPVTNGSMEIIYGLPTPNVTILDNPTANAIYDAQCVEVP